MSKNCHCIHDVKLGEHCKQCNPYLCHADCHYNVKGHKCTKEELDCSVAFDACLLHSNVCDKCNHVCAYCQQEHHSDCSESNKLKSVLAALQKIVLADDGLSS